MSIAVMSQNMGWGIIEGGWRKGPWTAEEDKLLIQCVKLHGEGRWNNVARLAGLRRNGKSCRLRWVNYLRPDLKRGQITPHEESIILELHARWGNRWSTIARSLPGRTDNEIKNYWRTHFKKKGEVSSANPEKWRTRLLRSEQFQLQHQQQQQQQQDQTSVKEVLSFRDENENQVPTLDQVKQEIEVSDELGFLYSMINGNRGSGPEASYEDVSWEGLWDLDEFYGSIANQHTQFANFS